MQVQSMPLLPLLCINAGIGVTLAAAAAAVGAFAGSTACHNSMFGWSADPG